MCVCVCVWVCVCVSREGERRRQRLHDIVAVIMRIKSRAHHGAWQEHERMLLLTGKCSNGSNMMPAAAAAVPR